MAGSPLPAAFHLWIVDGWCSRGLSGTTCGCVGTACLSAVAMVWLRICEELINQSCLPSFGLSPEESEAVQ